MKSKKEEEPLAFKEVVNSQFWLELGKELLEKAPERIRASSERFEKLIIWLWGIFTPLLGLSTTGLAIFSKIHFEWYLQLIIFTPSLTLILAYWFATRASSNQIISFYYNVADKIESGYLEGITQQVKEYSRAKFWTGISCVLIPISFVLASLGQKENMTLEASYRKEKRQIVVSGKTIDKKEIILSINGDTEKIEADDFRFYREYKLTEEEAKQKEIEIFYEYKEDGRTLRLVKVLKLVEEKKENK